jgi:hypothetical protein
VAAEEEGAAEGLEGSEGGLGTDAVAAFLRRKGGRRTMGE